MSVTFTPEIIAEIDISGYEVMCYTNDERTIAIVDTYETAKAIAQKHSDSGCLDCSVYGTAIDTRFAMPHHVNMANGNAAFVMSLLGIEFDDGCGAMDADQFLERLAFAGAIGRGDPGTVTIGYKEDGGATMIECGRSVGYVDMRLDQLIEIAEWAKEHNRRVVWS